MPGSLDLTALCGCANECPDCCANCCAALASHPTLHATFPSGFPGCRPTGSWAFPWDPVNMWWGKTLVTFAGCGYANIWFECAGTKAACSDIIMHFEIYDASMVLQCTDADVGENVAPETCACSPFQLDYHPTLSSCFSDLWDRGHIIVTL